MYSFICVTKWLKRKKNCAICRVVVKKYRENKQMHELCQMLSKYEDNFFFPINYEIFFFFLEKMMLFCYLQKDDLEHWKKRENEYSI